MLPRINRHVMSSHEYGFQQSDHSEKVVQPCFLKLSVQMRTESGLYVKVYYEGSQHAGDFWGAKAFSIVDPQNSELTGYTGKMASK